MDQPDYFIFAGEPSGDLHGEALIHQLYATEENANILCVGGPKMRKTKAINILEMEEFCVMGFTSIIPALPRIAKHFYALAKTILKLRPKVVVFIDYPGFALRLERHLRKKGFKGKLVHYICPSVWAHGKGRIQTIEENLSTLLSILPFEKNYFSPHFPVKYVGHPLVKRIQSYEPQPLSFGAGKKILSLFPGSRKKEIKLNLPLQIAACKQLVKEDPSLTIALSVSAKKFIPLIEEIILKSGLALHKDIHLVEEKDRYNLMKSSYLSIAKSGTVTLELALFSVPTTVIYRISKMELFIARDLLRIRLPFYCIVNILAGEKIFDELIGPRATLDSLVRSTKNLLKEEDVRKELFAKLEKVKKLLGDKDASFEAAKILSAEKNLDQALISSAPQERQQPKLQPQE